MAYNFGVEFKDVCVINGRLSVGYQTAFYVHLEIFVYTFYDSYKSYWTST